MVKLQPELVPLLFGLLVASGKLCVHFISKCSVTSWQKANLLLLLLRCKFALGGRAHLCPAILLAAVRCTLLRPVGSDGGAKRGS